MMTSLSATLAEKTRFLRTGGETGGLNGGGGARKEIDVCQYHQYWSCMCFGVYGGLDIMSFTFFFLSFPFPFTFIGCRVETIILVHPSVWDR